jgi:hypothetical protein
MHGFSRAAKNPFQSTPAVDQQTEKSESQRLETRN